jgi:predicted O-methyltransferase YrrM
MMNLFLFKRAFQFLSYLLRHPHRNGHGIHSPFLFDFVTKVLYKRKNWHQSFTDIERLRKSLLKNRETITVEDLGAGSGRKTNKTRKISDMVRYSSINPKNGRLLFNIIDYIGPEIIIELGTCLGFGSMYMAAGATIGKVYTIDGSADLSEKATENFERLRLTNIHARQGSFDDVLPTILEDNGMFDLMFIDGNHRKDAVLHYFALCLPYINRRSVIIFDDIRWSNEMFEGWLEICKHEKVRLSLDLFRLGIVFFDEKILKQHVEIYY